MQELHNPRHHNEDQEGVNHLQSVRCIILVGLIELLEG